MLLTADFRILLFKEGVVRTAAVPYSLEDLGDAFAHLSNHCIAATHPDYGAFESTNELWSSLSFLSPLCRQSVYCRSVYSSHLIPSRPYFPL